MEDCRLSIDNQAPSYVNGVTPIVNDVIPIISYTLTNRNLEIKRKKLGLKYEFKKLLLKFKNFSIFSESRDRLTSIIALFYFYAFKTTTDAADVSEVRIIDSIYSPLYNRCRRR